MNILVPTDFSDLSKVAIRYAIKMAQKHGGKVTLLHVIDIAQPTHASMQMRLRSLIDEIERTAKEDFEELMPEINKLNKGEPIKHMIQKGPSFTEAIRSYVKKHKPTLIVMGTHGASGLKKVLMGSNAASMLEASDVPVLAVPPEAKFKTVKSVVYATDLLNTAKEMKILVPFFTKDKPVVHIIHVAANKTLAEDAEQKIDKIVTKSGYKNVIVRVLINENPVTAINEYVVKIKVDMLVMFPHQYGFFEKLFKRSVTKQMTFHNNVPLLAFKSKK